jgi:hypothetical protein
MSGDLMAKHHPLSTNLAGQPASWPGSCLLGLGGESVALSGVRNDPWLDPLDNAVTGLGHSCTQVVATQWGASGNMPGATT